LPPDLEQLWVDKKAILNYDFKDLTALKGLRVCNGFTKRDELVNLGDRVRFKYVWF
jgi:hypothetical protein